MSLITFLREKAAELGFQAVGITSAAPLAEAEAAMLDRVSAGLMDGLPWFTPERVRRATRPADLLPGARSVVSLAASYLRRDETNGTPESGPRGRVAHYAWGGDYHQVLRDRTRALVDALAGELGRTPASRVFVDSSPLAERAVAQRSGVGWFGKNTNILVPRAGSYVFLASVILDVDLPEDEPVRTHCGSCTRCIDACPTGAITAPYTLDNTRCISFQTIENRGAIPSEIRPELGDWVFGCDICQEVCPVNRRAVETAIHEFEAASPDVARPPLLQLLTLTQDAYAQRFRGSAIKRAKAVGLRRNAAVALGNSGDRSTVPALSTTLGQDPSPLVRGHAGWALGRLGGRAARTALSDRMGIEDDPTVAGEVRAALDGA
ncbi:MAG: tRNA epoxyqueuosine(34) reductase QueG [Dehalococcoidia bacterium]|nr:tRNA epoxyqueuosine(34) reductase QueG [Dehalococcoidia bacterium]